MAFKINRYISLHECKKLAYGHFNQKLSFTFSIHKWLLNFLNEIGSNTKSFDF